MSPTRRQLIDLAGSLSERWTLSVYVLRFVPAYAYGGAAG
jgi:hypothetical protein